MQPPGVPFIESIPKHWLFAAWQVTDSPLAHIALELAANAGTGLAIIQNEITSVTTEAARLELRMIFFIGGAP